jgi:hypothetical protein
MNKPLLLRACLLGLAVLIWGNAVSAVEVGAILKSPGAYVHEKVEVEGMVEKLIGDQGRSTVFYILKDDFGDDIRVRSAEGHPKAGKRYRVTGVVSIHANSKEPYISEAKRVLQEKATAAVPPPVMPEPQEDDDTFLIVGLVVLGVALVGVAGFLASRQKGGGGAAPVPAVESVVATGAEEEEDEVPAAAGPPVTEVFETSTIKIELSPATMKFMPGSFEILSGEEEGQKIRLQGYPTRDGAETTIGREEVSGDRRFAHVQLKQPTVSRQQAKLVVRGGTYHLVNLGETNPSQVNGRELGVEESVELEPGDTVRFGEVELRFSA